MSLSGSFYNFLLTITSALKTNVDDYCEIEVTEGKYNIVFKDGTLMTILRYDGLLSVVPYSTVDAMCDEMDDRLKQFMNKSGHKLGFVFRRDLDANSSIARIERAKRITAENLSLDVADVIEEEAQLYGGRVYDEECYVALITMPSVLDKVELSTNAEYKAKLVAPRMATAQNLIAPIPVLRSRHSSFVEAFLSVISKKQYYARAEKIEVDEALAVVRHQFAPDYSSTKWRPVTVNNLKAMPLRWLRSNHPEDMSHILPPELSSQIMSHSVEVLGRESKLPSNTVVCAGRIYSYTMMNIPPTSPTYFNELFSRFHQQSSTDSKGNIRSMPYSVCFMLSGDGMAQAGLKAAMVSLIAKIPPQTNENVRLAIDSLRRIKNQDGCIVGIQMSAMTWADDNEHGREELFRRKTRLIDAVETWGDIGLIEKAGDPVQAWMSNILGASKNHHGPKGAAPFNQALKMLPLTRPANPFPNGSLMMMSTDGKLMPIEKFSPEQTTWVSVLTGIPGSGKSVQLNNELFEACLMPGLQRLPYICIIDVGISSRGLIEMLQQALPSDKQHLAVSRRLQNDIHNVINPFDVKVGLRSPLPTERAQISSFISAMVTPEELSTPEAGTTDFIGFLIGKLYDFVDDNTEKGQPKSYELGDNAELDEFLVEHDVINFLTDDVTGEVDFSTPEKITYYELVERLHKLGSYAYRARDLAHRYAMPTLPDLASVLKDPEILDDYSDLTRINAATVKTAINQAVANYPAFSRATNFDVDTARVIALDLNDVINPSNPKQTSLFYQAAMMVGLKQYSLKKEDMIYIPPLFRSYYTQLLRDVSDDRKILAFDEMHNARGITILMNQVSKTAREARKWNMELLLASQYVTDFEELLPATTRLSLCSEPTGDEKDLLRKVFNLNDTQIYEMENIKLDRNGLTFFNYVRGRDAVFTSLLRLVVGPKRLWSLTTDSDDRLLKGYVMERTSREIGIAALAWRFPGGSAKKYINQLKMNSDAEAQERGEDIKEGDDSRGRTIVSRLAASLVEAFDEEMARVYNAQQMGI